MNNLNLYTEAINYYEDIIYNNFFYENNKEDSILYAIKNDYFDFKYLEKIPHNLLTDKIKRLIISKMIFKYEYKEIDYEKLIYILTTYGFQQIYIDVIICFPNIVNSSSENIFREFIDKANEEKKNLITNYSEEIKENIKENKKNKNKIINEQIISLDTQNISIAEKRSTIRRLKLESSFGISKRINILDEATKKIKLCKFPNYDIIDENNILEKYHHKKCMKHSKKQIEWLYFIHKYLKINIQHILNNGEYKIGNYYVDGFNEKFNIVFEFNGCYFHGCKKCFNENKLFRYDTDKNINVYMKDLYERTLNKKKYILDNGYNYVAIWECEWNNYKKNNDITFFENLKNHYQLC